jgi:hypothetical protein
MSIDGKAPSTISTYIAAISFVHKINGWWDPTANFIVKKLKEGCKRLKGHVDNRRPISLSILKQLCRVTQGICSTQYEATMFKAAFAIAFFGFLRIGEFTETARRGQGAHNLKIGDVSFKGDAMFINIKSSKTDQQGVSATLRFERNANDSLCPVGAMISYLEARSAREGSLFIHFDGSPLTQYQFSSVLRKCISAVGLEPKEFSPHSFRIGAATAAAVGGIPLESIMNMGRWQSSAVELYIRPQRIIQASAWREKI